jgi:DNA (cytosine-5)-methyltransferase 1
VNGRRTHLDLFSGIGGFAIASGWAGFETVSFCEQDSYCKRVLRKNFPSIPIVSDIRNLDGKKFRGVDLITGGFPCQPVSYSGKRKGKADDRFIWSEMARVISEAKPDWVLAENVTGIISMGLDEVLSDMASLAYSVEAILLPACAVDAYHKRERVWIVADSDLPRTTSPEFESERSRKKRTDEWKNRSQSVSCGFGNVKRTEREPGWISEPGICRVAYGLPDRVDRLRGLGNSIVPQLAYEIIKEMKER